MQETINHPPHYTGHPSGVEAIDICEHLGFNCGAAFKYLFRRNLKHPTPLDDLKKAVWYITREAKNVNNGNYVAVGDVSKLMFSRFDHDFFEGCWTPLVTRVLKVIEHENMRIAAAMAYLVRGWELQDPIDLFIAAFFVEEEIKHVST